MRELRNTPNAGAPGLPARRIAPILISLALAALCVLLLGCAVSEPAPPATNHRATVEALLPTAEPTEPPNADAADIPPTPADTPSPTYTPRPRPTYTPRPAPTPATAKQREPAIGFQAVTLDGSEIRLDDTLGSPTLLAFWAPW